MEYEEEDTAARFQILSMRLGFKENCTQMVTSNKDSAIDFKKPFRIFMSDLVRVLEIYNSVKLKELYEDLDDIIIQKNLKRIKVVSSISGEDNDDSGSSRKQKEGGVSNSENYADSDLPVMGPNGDILAGGYFHVIIHQDTGHPETDEAHLVKATPYYRYGRPVSNSDIVASSTGYGPPYMFHPFPFVVPFPFGKLAVVGMIYEPSWLVTVSVYVEKKHVGESYICGELKFWCEAYHTFNCALIQTPRNKVIKVGHGESIPLLRYTFAVPRVPRFTVDADLVDPINNSSVKGYKDFEFAGFSEIEDYSQSEVIGGEGAQIKVKLTMKPNDFDLLSRFD